MSLQKYTSMIVKDEDLPAVLKVDRRKQTLCTLYDFYVGTRNVDYTNL